MTRYVRCIEIDIPVSLSAIKPVPGVWFARGISWPGILDCEERPWDIPPDPYRYEECTETILHFLPSFHNVTEFTLSSTFIPKQRWIPQEEAILKGACKAFAHSLKRLKLNYDFGGIFEREIRLHLVFQDGESPIRWAIPGGLEPDRRLKKALTWLREEMPSLMSVAVRIRSDGFDIEL
jgi:hypothetical protein